MKDAKPKSGDQGPQERGGSPDIEATVGGKAAKPERTSRPGPGEGWGTIRLVPASDLAANPDNPFDNLRPEERFARFLALLADIYSNTKDEETKGKGPRQAA